jgi:hypothetical protein
LCRGHLNTTEVSLQFHRRKRLDIHSEGKVSDSHIKVSLRGMVSERDFKDKRQRHKSQSYESLMHLRDRLATARKSSMKDTKDIDSHTNASLGKRSRQLLKGIS